MIIDASPMTDRRPKFFTIGHSTRDLEVFIALLHAHGVTTIADVRTVPRSRRNPQFDTDALARSLPDAGIAYVVMPALGGWRKTSEESTNTAWRSTSFRGYADYMQTPEFAAAIDRLLELGRETQVAFMCAEAVPWRCHRSLIADALTARGYEVRHIVSTTKAERHRMTPFAKVEGTSVTYPAMI